MNAIRRIGIVGAGAWGTTLGLVAGRAGSSATVWAFEPDVAEAINTRHENPYLHGVELDPALRATHRLGDLADADALLLVTPAQHLRGICTELSRMAPDGIPAVICAKGIEIATGKLLSDVVAETMPRSPVAVLSGPTFAAEVARGQPAAVTLACADDGLAGALIAALGAPAFRPYRSTDQTGAQVGGAVKNVLAIASGIVTGRALGDSARAALITRGMAEMLRLGEALGGERETLMGLSGLGDLVLTCTSATSRNMRLGIALGEERPPAATAHAAVAEGVATAAAVSVLAARLDVDMPICAAVDAVVNHGAAIDGTIRALMDRPFRAETDA
ncbi:MAG: NAD(P)-dependent glycerol-3-phosphate dehydrogenase [Proteobacteria bacterium]|nr:NAD(P)-dependent glycerol-3-phosphate dehydrogenase [Pseudomonadota bacterium]MDA1132769.1 NAD(P)-dependent glycerol-3-phosphate dehydrogenase [Pseudomonadota bacterium]